MHHHRLHQYHRYNCFLYQHQDTLERTGISYCISSSYSLIRLPSILILLLSRRFSTLFQGSLYNVVVFLYLFAYLFPLSSSIQFLGVTNLGINLPNLLYVSPLSTLHQYRFLLSLETYLDFDFHMLYALPLDISFSFSGPGGGRTHVTLSVQPKIIQASLGVCVSPKYSLFLQ